MNIDFIRGVTAHLTAAFVVVGGLVAIVWLTATGTFPADAGLPAIAAIIAGAAGFMWGAEVAKQSAKQAEKNIAQGQQNPPGP